MYLSKSMYINTYILYFSANNKAVYCHLIIIKSAFIASHIIFICIFIFARLFLIMLDNY